MRLLRNSSIALRAWSFRMLQAPRSDDEVWLMKNIDL